ncbi:MAG TPA: alpha/beta hydrolase [Ktedonobacteraceae bacterium]|jgi:phospholipase/carboxylesterase/glyoxalase family protein
MDRREQPLNGFLHRFVPADAQQQTAEQETLPTLLLLHGTGGSENDLLELGQTLVPGAALLSPRGKVLENGMARFFRRLAEGVFDIADLKQRTDELAGFITTASAAYHFDPAHVIAVGYSNGANIAASMLLLHPGVLSAAVLLRPMVPLVPEPLPDLTGIPVFISAGRMDPIVIPHETDRLERLLRQCGATVTTRWHSGGHALSHEDVHEAKTWLQGRK